VQLTPNIIENKDATALRDSEKELLELIAVILVDMVLNENEGQTEIIDTTSQHRENSKKTPRTGV